MRVTFVSRSAEIQQKWPQSHWYCCSRSSSAVSDSPCTCCGGLPSPCSWSGCWGSYSAAPRSGREAGTAGTGGNRTRAAGREAALPAPLPLSGPGFGPRLPACGSGEPGRPMRTRAPAPYPVSRIPGAPWLPPGASARCARAARTGILEERLRRRKVVVRGYAPDAPERRRTGGRIATAARCRPVAGDPGVRAMRGSRPWIPHCPERRRRRAGAGG
jgi:hypothetical protein